jgi:hypothetical protein
VAYGLAQFAADCRAALLTDAGPAGREWARRYTARACADPGFVAAHLGPGERSVRKLLYEDPELRFLILAHVQGALDIPPHDHGPTWAIYGQAGGITEMTDWQVVERPQAGLPGTAVRLRSYRLMPGMAQLYDAGALHSLRTDGETRVVRIEGADLTGIKRDRFEIAA